MSGDPSARAELLSLRLQRGGGVRGWGSNGLGTGARGSGTRARRALLLTTLRPHGDTIGDHDAAVPVGRMVCGGGITNTLARDRGPPICSTGSDVIHEVVGLRLPGAPVLSPAKAQRTAMTIQVLRNSPMSTPTLLPAEPAGRHTLTTRLLAAGEH